MLSAEATSFALSPNACDAGAVGREDELRQVELEIGVHAADRRHWPAGVRWSSLALRPISWRFGPVTTNCSGSVRWPGNTPKPRANTRAPGTCASSRRIVARTCCCERMPFARRSSFGSMRITSVAWLTCCAEPSPMMPHSVTTSGNCFTISSTWRSRVSV